MNYIFQKKNSFCRVVIYLVCTWKMKMKIGTNKAKIKHFGELGIVLVLTFAHCVQLNFSEWNAKEVQLYCVNTAQLEWKPFPLGWNLWNMKIDNFIWLSIRVRWFQLFFKLFFLPKLNLYEWLLETLLS